MPLDANGICNLMCKCMQLPTPVGTPCPQHLWQHVKPPLAGGGDHRGRRPAPAGKGDLAHARNMYRQLTTPLPPTPHRTPPPHTHTCMPSMCPPPLIAHLVGLQGRRLAGGAAGAGGLPHSAAGRPRAAARGRPQRCAAQGHGGARLRGAARLAGEGITNRPHCVSLHVLYASGRALNARGCM